MKHPDAQIHPDAPPRRWTPSKSPPPDTLDAVDAAQRPRRINQTTSKMIDMRLTLEARIAATEVEIATAEQEKLQKEESAQKALKEQEVVMDTIVQESKRLQQHAEENTKAVRSVFLVDVVVIMSNLF